MSTPLAVQLFHLDNTYEIIQYSNRCITLAICILIHLIIIARLFNANGFILRNDYQILILVQSSVNVFSSISDFLLNEIQTTDTNVVKIGHPFLHYTETQRNVITGMTVVLSYLVEDLLALFNIHRLVMFTRPHKIRNLYRFYIPICIFSCLLNLYSAWSDIETGHSIGLFFKYSQIPFLVIAIVYCFVKLQIYFAKNESISEKTKHLQKKLSIAILLQVLLLVLISIIVNFLPSFVLFIQPKINVNTLHAIHSIVAVLFVQWCPVLSALLIVWSIIGFIKNPNKIGC